MAEETKEGPKAKEAPKPGTYPRAMHHPLFDYGVDRRVNSEEEERALVASDSRWRPGLYSEEEIADARAKEAAKKRSKA